MHSTRTHFHTKLACIISYNTMSNVPTCNHKVRRKTCTLDRLHIEVFRFRRKRFYRNVNIKGKALFIQVLRILNIIFLIKIIRRSDTNHLQPSFMSFKCYQWKQTISKIYTAPDTMS
jgi:hypothetical protein